MVTGWWYVVRKQRWECCSHLVSNEPTATQTSIPSPTREHSAYTVHTYTKTYRTSTSPVSLKTVWQSEQVIHKVALENSYQLYSVNIWEYFSNSLAYQPNAGARPKWLRSQTFTTLMKARSTGPADKQVRCRQTKDLNQANLRFKPGSADPRTVSVDKVFKHFADIVFRSL